MTAAEGDQVELRGPCPRDVVDMLDAISMARSLTRNQLLVDILSEWARVRHREANLVVKCTRFNPSDAGASGKDRR